MVPLGCRRAVLFCPVYLEIPFYLAARVYLGNLSGSC